MAHKLYSHPLPLILPEKRSQHAYVINCWTPTIKARIELVVEANNRDQAARLCSRLGYAVRDVNMVG